jgi:hypothetical protein
VLLLVVHIGCGLKGSAAMHYFSLVLVSLIGVGLGLGVSAAARTTESAVALLPLALLPMVMLGGVMMPIHDMRTIAQPIAHSMPSRWAFGALVETESDQQPHSPPAPAPPNPPQRATTPSRDMAEKFFPEKNGRSGTAASQFVMMMMLCALYAAVHLILWKRDLH